MSHNPFDIRHWNPTFCLVAASVETFVTVIFAATSAWWAAAFSAGCVVFWIGAMVISLVGNR